MVPWAVAILLFLIWLVGVALFHKGGFIHMLLLTALAMFVVLAVAHRKASQ